MMNKYILRYLMYRLLVIIDKRLVDAVGEEMADDIILEMMLNPDNVQKQLVNISTDGNVTSKILDEYANVVK